MEIKKQIGSPLWANEAGLNIPANRVTNSEKLAEKEAYTLAKEALRINELLVKFKSKIIEACEQVEVAIRKENGAAKDGYKGNLTFYNFDRSIKIERNVNEPISFDEQLIRLASEKADEYLTAAIKVESPDDTFLISLVKDSFKTTRGKFDTKKIMMIIRYASKTQNPIYHEMVDLAQRAIRKPESKAYYNVYVKDSQGEYIAVLLNFSAL